MTLFDLLAAATPTPAPLDEDSVTPGWVGFVFIFAVALITVFLIIDMTRRVRRVRYREEVREKLAAEENETK
jgi:TRAP-type C4-dicarboxylate transport system permease small subunit